MNAKADVVAVIRQWVQKAEEDFFSMDLLFIPEENCPFTAVCFHAQQCVEKYIKGLLVSLSIEFPRTHDLEELHRLVPRSFNVPISEDEKDQFSHFAALDRYPGDYYPLARDQAREAVAVARRVREAVRALLPKEALDS